MNEKELSPQLEGDELNERLKEHYNKFCEDKRLTHRRGQMEYRISMKYIHDYLAEAEIRERNAVRDADDGVNGDAVREADDDAPSDRAGYAACDAAAVDNEAADEVRSSIRILDIGAGTGRYSAALAEEGYDVTAVELVKYNLGILKSKSSRVNAMQGNALHLSKLPDDYFDLTLLFGPMYHLFSHEDKLQALSEAKRVTKPGGVIMIAYCMNEYSVLTYAFREHHILECLENGTLTEDFHTVADSSSLYDYMRIEDIDALVEECGGFDRLKIISPDGPASYMRPFINHMSEEEFEALVKYQLATCERQDLIGAGTHTVDILRKRQNAIFAEG